MPEVVLYTRGMQNATDEIVSVGGRVTQQFGGKVVVADIPEGVDPKGDDRGITAFCHGRRTVGLSDGADGN